MFILLLEDDKDIKDLITEVLTFSGARILSTCSCEDATRLLVEQKPDLLLADLKIGTKICIEVLHKANELGIRTILMSAFPKAETLIEDAHIEAFISKPFDLFNLERLILKNKVDF